MKTAAVDHDKLRGLIGQVIEKAKADDPKELRKRNGELEKQLAAKPAAAAVKATPAKPIEVPIVTEKEIKRIEAASAAIAKALERVATELGKGPIGNAQQAIEAVQVDLANRLAKLATTEHPLFTREVPKALHDAGGKAWFRKNVSPETNGLVKAKQAAGGSLGKGERQILTAIAQTDGGVSREQLTILTGYKRSSRDTYLQRLGARRLITDAGKGSVQAAAMLFG